MSFQAQGMRAWLLQRLTAVYIALYLISLIAWCFSQAPIAYDAWSQWFHHPVVLIATILFYFSLFIHAWVGVRDIMVDYVKPSSVRFIALVGLAVFISVMTIWLLLIVINLVQA
ncbi:MAG: succinate dehydrogenase, hydrophobic membrane anchor protein [Woeseiaceae bacterium]